MAQNKTQPTSADVHSFLNSIEHPQKREDSFALLQLMQKLTGEQPVMWGDAIIGFGKNTYRYASGRSGDWFTVGFSPRKQNLTIYLMCGLDGLQGTIEKLGKYKTGKGCLYINKLSDVDRSVLEQVLTIAIETCRNKHE
ncbi:DUF1801 domain-containing protein [Carboxylicivirga mesophila]|uniref:DUF1801 domain-containing protein n=1 Tax=Carboxylicivirga mesophila TaxID=1166478 RepID=A0ABS5KFY2_9BACT|nr:DUF1801 domain-containing protein [Carboxylicivirga mesophila]MBS2213989.1 DUF1801 domain-containing protein [Carboxylicivirga mesophila]